MHTKPKRIPNPILKSPMKAWLKRTENDLLFLIAFNGFLSKIGLVLHWLGAHPSRMILFNETLYDTPQFVNMFPSSLQTHFACVV